MTQRSTPTSSPAPGSTSTAGSRSSTRRSRRTDGAAALMAVASSTKTSARRRHLEAATNYPTDWLAERSGLVGGIKYRVLRKVPGHTNWFHPLGSAALTAFLIQALTGSIHAMYY